MNAFSFDKNKPRMTCFRVSVTQVANSAGFSCSE
jgi:hypothetical protein